MNGQLLNYLLVIQGPPLAQDCRNQITTSWDVPDFPVPGSGRERIEFFTRQTRPSGSPDADPGERMRLALTGCSGVAYRDGALCSCRTMDGLGFLTQMRGDQDPSMRVPRTAPGSMAPVVIVGRHSIGKSTFAVHLASALNARVIEMGDIVRAEAARRGESNLVRLAERLLSSDPLAIARLTSEVSRLGTRPVVIVGPRTPEELNYLRSQFPDAFVAGLDGSTHLRHSRWRQRELTFTDTWEERESQEKAWRTEAVLASSDVILKADDPEESKLEWVMSHRLFQRA